MEKDFAGNSDFNELATRAVLTREETWSENDEKTKKNKGTFFN